MGLVFSNVERHVLVNTGGFSRQLISYWEQAGYVPSRHVLKVHHLIGRRIEDLVGGQVPEEPTRQAAGKP